MPLAESPDKQLQQQQQQTPHEGSSENQFQDHIQQQQHQAFHSSLLSQEELPVASQAPNLECTKQQSDMVEGAVRQLQLVPGENQPRSRPAVIDDDKQSKLGTEAVEGERIEEDMEHTGLQLAIVDPFQVREHELQSVTSCQPQIIHEEIQSSKRPKTIHPSQMIQDGIEPLQTELETIHTSQISVQNEIPTQIFTKQKTVQETLLPRSEISERALSPRPELSQAKQQELVPTTSLQV